MRLPIMNIFRILTLITVFILTVSVLGTAASQNAQAAFEAYDEKAEFGTEDTSNMYVLVNSSLYGPLEDQLNQYKQDVEEIKDLNVKIFENNHSEASEIRSFLKEGYENDDLVGTFFVGNLPYAEFEVSDDYGEGRYARFPIDLYYKDLDGTWRDTNNSGVYDEHVPGEGDLDPEIWFGRISMKTDWEDEIDLYKNYFEKLYRYRRGNLSLPDDSLLYIDDDWVPWTDYYRSGLAELYSNVTVVNDTDITRADDYGEKLNEGYEWIQIHCHANHSAKRHAFRKNGGPKGSGGNFTSRDLYEGGQKSLFANVFTCGSADYTVPDYMCGWYALTDEYGLANVGSTKPGSMLEFHNYYEPLSNGMTMGEAMKQWWIETVGSDKDSISWFYGMTTIGDPTLTPLSGALDEYELEVDIQGQGEVEIDPDQDGYIGGTEVTLIANASEGWYFEGWNGTEKTGEEITITMDEDKVITAHFREAKMIRDWYDLNETRDDLGARYVLMNDLDEETAGYDELVDTKEGWEPIGRHSTPSFTGTFDGQGYEIRNLHINRLEEEYNGIGLFDILEDGAEITDVGIVDADVNGESNVGGLVGWNYGGSVKNSSVTGNVSGERRIGGLVGWNFHESTVSNSYAAGNISGEKSVGGLVGYNSGIVENSHYNIDEVAINGGHHITIGGLFDDQYQDWIEEKDLDIADYSETLEPSGNYYEISSIDGLRDLLGFAGYEGYKFLLTEDINLSDEPGLYIPYIAADFDGNGHTVSGLNIDLPFAPFLGMFGWCGGNVTNIGMVDADVNGDGQVGGLVGWNNDATVSHSYATGKVSGERKIGGLVGWNNDATVSHSYATGKVSGSEDVGGLVGFNVGFNEESTVNNSYATGEVSGEEEIGGLVGSNDGTVSDSFWNVETSGLNKSDGGTGKTTAEMKNVATYTDTTTGGLEESWDFVDNPYDDAGDEDIWDIDKGYPFLAELGSVKFTLGVTTEGEGFVDVDPDKERYVHGEAVNLTAYPEEGWYLDGWSGTEKTGEEITIKMDQEKEIVANFEEYATLTIKNITGEGTVYVDGDVVEAPFEKNYEEGKEADLEAIAAESWDFVEWGGDASGTEDEITITMDGDKEITAQFDVNELDLTIEIEGKGSTDPEEGTHSYEHGEEATITATPAEGWEFVEWTGDANGTDPTMNVTIDANKSITAVFEEVGEYDLTINIEGEGSTEPVEGTQSYEEGTVVTVEAMPSEGWEFVEWTGDHPVSGSESKLLNITMDEKRSITAVFEELEPEFEVTDFNVDPTEGDTPIEVNITAEIENVGGAEGTITLETDDQELNSWSLGPEDKATVDEAYTYEEEGSYHVELGNESISVEVAEVETYTLEITTDGEGTVDVEPDREKYEEETEVTLTADPDEGREFVEWTGHYDGTEEEITVTMDENKSITAHFKEEQEPDPAHFEIEIIECDDEVEEGEEVTIRFKVTNTGGLEGTQDVRLYLEGEEVENDTDIKLKPGGEYEGEFTWEAEKVGEQEFEVRSSDKSETIDVNVMSDDGEDRSFVSNYRWLILVLLIGIVALVALIFVMKGEEKKEELVDEDMDGSSDGSPPSTEGKRSVDQAPQEESSGHHEETD